MVELLHIDCMEYMATCKDKQFDLAICDVNYGIGEDGLKNHSRGNLTKPTLYTPKEWDKKPVEKVVLDEIIRISKKQIIWGANHFISKLPYDSSCWIVWDKMNGENDFVGCEIDKEYFDAAVKRFENHKLQMKLF